MKDISDEIDHQENKESEQPATKRHPMFIDAVVPERKSLSNPNHPEWTPSGDMRENTNQNKQFSSGTHQQTFQKKKNKSHTYSITICLATRDMHQNYNPMIQNLTSMYRCTLIEMRDTITETISHRLVDTTNFQIYQESQIMYQHTTSPNMSMWCLKIKKISCKTTNPF